MDHSSHSSPSILVIIGISAFSRHRMTDPVFVIHAVCPQSRVGCANVRRAPNLDVLAERAKVVCPAIRPAHLALPYRRTLQLTNGSNNLT